MNKHFVVALIDPQTGVRRYLHKKGWSRSMVLATCYTERGAERVANRFYRAFVVTRAFVVNTQSEKDSK